MNVQLKKRLLPLWVYMALLLTSSTILGLTLSPLTGPTYTGDLSALEKKRVVRVLVSADLGFYYIEDGLPKGIIAELLHHFELDIHKTYPKLNIQVIPVHRDQLIPFLIAGHGDLAVANLTITEQRKKQVAFSEPVLSNISEVIINNIDFPEITQIEQLSDKEIWVRKSSSYYQSLLEVNNRLRLQRLDPMKIHFIEETLQDYELLEMVNLGLMNMTVLDEHKMKIWQTVLPKLRMNSAFVLRSNGEIAWAMRKESPQLMTLVNTYIEQIKSGTLLGNVIYNKYLDNQGWITNLLSDNNIDKMEKLSDLFFKYSSEYDFDYLMMMAQGFQESGLNQHKVSNKGAVGIMQVLPSTARDRYINIPNIYTSSNNVHAGIKYMRYIQNNYLDDNRLTFDNKMYMTLASYNAGPGNIRKMRRYAKEKGYNPDIWFNNVEIITRKHIGKQPVVYVTNINRYYIVYKQLMSLKKYREKGIRPFVPPYRFDAPTVLE
ncbi:MULTISPECIES: lytic transglycosylase F [unclassified Photobacterium]|uniref:transglycosylase SLT domain-containing protein n=1 Tax=unclassified Photobacterium TaxID=2628852 RepID=UPI001EDF496B|nr:MULTISPECIES: lytic transglycosylase F [unclassified Photobacterium]MCG3864519.1 lytic transglycosylase F [Photobacterium sp. Ph6]MCG3876588.1 lytic transglycosylase F [Photobacterium sp. Ph5]